MRCTGDILQLLGSERWDGSSLFAPSQGEANVISIWVPRSSLVVSAVKLLVWYGGTAEERAAASWPLEKLKKLFLCCLPAGPRHNGTAASTPDGSNPILWNTAALPGKRQ